jgi:hypothetical protein
VIFFAVGGVGATKACFSEGPRGMAAAYLSKKYNIFCLLRDIFGQSQK